MFQFLFPGSGGGSTAAFPLLVPQVGEGRGLGALSLLPSSSRMGMHLDHERELVLLYLMLIVEIFMD